MRQNRDYLSHLVSIGDSLGIKLEPEQINSPEYQIININKEGYPIDLSLVKEHQSQIEGIILQEPKSMSSAQLCYYLFFGFQYRKNPQILSQIKRLMVFDTSSTQFYLDVHVEVIRSNPTRKSVDYAMFLYSNYSENFNLRRLEDVIEREILI